MRMKSYKKPSVAIIIVGSFSNDDGDGSKNFKKAIGLISKTETLHVQQTFFCTFLCRHCTITE